MLTNKKDNLEHDSTPESERAESCQSLEQLQFKELLPPGAGDKWNAQEKSDCPLYIQHGGS